jgi:hypothetical protein
MSRGQREGSSWLGGETLLLRRMATDLEVCGIETPCQCLLLTASCAFLHFVNPGMKDSSVEF